MPRQRRSKSSWRRRLRAALESEFWTKLRTGVWPGPPVAVAMSWALTACVAFGLAAFGSNSEPLSLCLTALVSTLLVFTALLAKDPPTRAGRKTMQPSWQRQALYVIGGLFLLYWLSVLATGLLSADQLPQAGIWSGLGPSRVALDLSALTVALLNLSGLAAGFVCAFILATEDKRAVRLLDLIVWSCVGLIFVTLIMHWRDPTAIWGLNKITGVGRFSLSLSSPNIAGTFCGIIVLLTLSRAMSTWQNYPKQILHLLPWVIMCAIAITGLILTESRGALIATAIALVLFLILIALAPGKATQKAKTDKPILAARTLGFASLGIAGLALVIGVSAFNPSSPIVARMTQGSQSYEDRLSIYRAHTLTLTPSLINGYGPGSFDALNRAALTHDNAQPLYAVRAMHNAPLQTLQEVGVMGFVLIVATIGAVLFVQIRGLIVRRRQTLELAALTCGSVLILLHSTAEYSLQEPAFAMLWAVLLGLGSALAGNTSARLSRSATPKSDATS